MKTTRTTTRHFKTRAGEPNDLKTMSMAALSTSRILRERVSSTTNASVSATRKSNFIHQRNRHRAADVRSTAASEDDYNAAMKAYSETPYEYKHELGLCKCAEKTVARFSLFDSGKSALHARMTVSDASTTID